MTLVLAVLSSAVVSGLVTTWLGARYQRDSQLRTRMLAVAEEHMTQLLLGLRSARDAGPAHALTPEQWLATRKVLDDVLDEVGDGLGRVVIAFGATSQVVEHASAALKQLRGVGNAL